MSCSSKLRTHFETPTADAVEKIRLGTKHHAMDFESLPTTRDLKIRELAFGI